MTDFGIFALCMLVCLGVNVAVCFSRSTKTKVPGKNQPHWEVVPSTDAGDVIGYRVRWSEPDDRGCYLWVAHYLSGEELSLAWCQTAAQLHCQRLIREGRVPWEWDSYKPRSKHK